MSAPDEESRPGPSLTARVTAGALVVLAVCMLALTSFTCLLLYRTARTIEAAGMAIDRVGQRVDSIGEKVDAMAESVAGVGQKVDRTTGAVADVAEMVKDGVSDLGGELSAEEDALIKGLLAAVRRSDLTFVRSGNEKSGLRMYGWLYSKYNMHKLLLDSADDFITQVATKSLGGDAYEIIEKDGDRRPLADWLSERLVGLRAAQAVEGN